MAVNGLAIKELARSLAFVAHEGQSRKGTGEPYFNHVEGVADAVQGWEAKVVAYLHDVIEDTKITADTLLLIGIPEYLVKDVVTLTKESKTPLKDYQEGVLKGNTRVRRVKLADVEYNLRDIDDVADLSDGKKAQYLSLQAQLYESLNKFQSVPYNGYYCC